MKSERAWNTRSTGPYRPQCGQGNEGPQKALSTAQAGTHHQRNLRLRRTATCKGHSSSQQQVPSTRQAHLISPWASLLSLENTLTFLLSQSQGTGHQAHACLDLLHPAGPNHADPQASPPHPYMPPSLVFQHKTQVGKCLCLQLLLFWPSPLIPLLPLSSLFLSPQQPSTALESRGHWLSPINIQTAPHEYNCGWWGDFHPSAVPRSGTEKRQ